LNIFDKKLTECFLNKHTEISDDIKTFVFAKSKKLRPKLIFLLTKALGENITEKIYNIAICTELLHNSTLIHDDIVDNAQIRRGNISLNQKLGNNLSVLAGDYLLSLSMQFLAKCQNIECLNIFANSLKHMCEGEIKQHFDLGQIPTIEEYIEKSKNKTAELFKASLISASLLLNKEKKLAEEFAENFGIAFQIRDDLLNILETDISKPTLSDIHNKIYTAPVIFLEKNIENLSTEEIIKELKTEKIEQKTIELIKEYATKAIASLDDIKDNQYKEELITLSKNLYKVF
jgi:geranylgeranyl pyrophosphate synthase